MLPERITGDPLRQDGRRRGLNQERRSASTGVALRRQFQVKRAPLYFVSY